MSSGIDPITEYCIVSQNSDFPLANNLQNHGLDELFIRRSK
jgi:hypothetical protein